MHYHQRDAAHSRAMIELRRLNPSDSNPIPVLTACYDKLTQDCNRYEVAVVIKCGKCAWRRDQFNASGRAEVRGVIVRVLHAIDSDTLAVIDSHFKDQMEDNKREREVLRQQRENLLNARAEDVEAALLV